MWKHINDEIQRDIRVQSVLAAAGKINEKDIKRLHHLYVHTYAEELRNFLNKAGIGSKEITKVEILKRCDVCNKMKRCDVCNKIERCDVCNKMKRCDVCNKMKRCDVCNKIERCDVCNKMERCDVCNKMKR